MELISDILLGIGAIGAGVYCFVLSLRLKRMQDLDTGLGNVVQTMSTQVQELTNALENAQSSNEASNQAQTVLTERAEGAAQRLELLIASLHDIQEPHQDVSNGTKPAVNGRSTETDVMAEEPNLMFVRHSASSLEAASHEK